MRRFLCAALCYLWCSCLPVFAAAAPVSSTAPVAASVADTYTEKDFEYEQPPAPRAGSLLGSILRTILALILVAGMILLSGWAYARFGKKARLFSGGIQPVTVIGSTWIAPRKGIYVVEVLGRILVLGVSEAGINTLFETSDATLLKTLTERMAQEEQQPGATSFAQHMKNFKERFK
jgi:flagellar biogenesis protein FliO